MSTEKPTVEELAAALAWALEHVSDDLDLDEQQAKAEAESLVARATKAAMGTACHNCGAMRLWKEWRCPDCPCEWGSEFEVLRHLVASGASVWAVRSVASGPIAAEFARLGDGIDIGRNGGAWAFAAWLLGAGADDIRVMAGGLEVLPNTPALKALTTGGLR